MPISTKGFAAHKAAEPLSSFTFDRRDVGPNDVHIKIYYCGVCHSDLHQARDEVRISCVLFALYQTAGVLLD